VLHCKVLFALLCFGVEVLMFLAVASCQLNNKASLLAAALFCNFFGVLGIQLYYMLLLLLPHEIRFLYNYFPTASNSYRFRIISHRLVLLAVGFNFCMAVVVGFSVASIVFYLDSSAVSLQGVISFVLVGLFRAAV